jgi:hypothetical protein
MRFVIGQMEIRPPGLHPGGREGRPFWKGWWNRRESVRIRPRKPPVLARSANALG